MEGSRHCVLRKQGGYAGPRGIESLMAVTSNSVSYTHLTLPTSDLV